MQIAAILVIVLALPVIGTAQVFPVQTILENGLPEKRINYVFLSDGYQAAELPAYIGQIQAMRDFLFTQPPFQQYRNFFNMYAISVPSVESGADHPGTAADEGAGGTQPITTVNTYFNSTFDYASIHRLVVPQNTLAIGNVLIDNFPNYDQAFVLVNSPYYGGSGGSYPASTTDASSQEIAIHEIGHSFAALADEYAIGGQGEAPNRTANADPATIRWKNWLGDAGIGIFPVGIDGWQRPHEACKMRFLGVPFCAVCTEAFIDRIYAFVTPIYSAAPAAATVAVTGPTTFSANLTRPEPNTLNTAWQLNGTTIASSTDSVLISPVQLDTGSNTLTLYVTDQTALARTYLPNAGYVFSQSWSLTKASSPVQTVGQPDKFYYQLSPNPTIDVLTISGNLDYSTKLGVELYSEFGERVYAHSLQVEGAYQHDLRMTVFASGIYTVVLRLANGFSVQAQVVKIY